MKVTLVLVSTLGQTLLTLGDLVNFTVPRAGEKIFAPCDLRAGPGQDFLFSAGEMLRVLDVRYRFGGVHDSGAVDRKALVQLVEIVVALAAPQKA